MCTKTIVIVSLFTLLFGAQLQGCKQGEGERCQYGEEKDNPDGTKSYVGDCQEGYICCVLPANRLLGGTCQKKNICEQSSTDSGIGSDSTIGTPDSGTKDQSVDKDAAKADAIVKKDSATKVDQKVDAKVVDAQSNKDATQSAQ